MKRRNVDCVKPRRPLKRNKISEGFYGSCLVYFKFGLVWLLVLAADYLLDFRFEYLWPFWLLLRSVYDSFRYQGMAFCVLFVLMAVTADLVAIMFIPASWLFFAASTYVWVQFVWHTDKGVCMPTIVLWAVFIYIEAVVRLKEVKNVPFHLDLCRPFAAHCIGYPVVTLGFGLKSYVGYRLRQRKQREVARENEFYFQLLQEALPPDLQHIKNRAQQAAALKEFIDGEREAELNGPPVISTSTSGRRGSRVSSPSASSPSSRWRKEFPLLLVRLILSISSWWQNLLATPDTIYKIGSSQTLNNCIASNSSNTVSSSSSCSSSCSTSSCSSNSSSNRGSTAASNHRVASKTVSASSSSNGESVVNGGLTATPNGAALHHHNSSSPSSASVQPVTAVAAAVSSKHNNKTNNNTLHSPLECMQKSSSSSVRSGNNFDEQTGESEKTVKEGPSLVPSLDSDKPCNKQKANIAPHSQSNGPSKGSSHNKIEVVASCSGGGKKNRIKDSYKEATSQNNVGASIKDDSTTIVKLEGELKRTRSELSSSRSTEQDLRNQLNSLLSNNKQFQQDVAQLQQENETLQSKLQSLSSARQSERSSLTALERRVAEERRLRQTAEAQYQQLDRRHRKLEEQQQQQQQRHKSSGECTDTCRKRRNELEAELKRLRRDQRAQEDRTRAFELENVALRQTKESQNDNEELLNTLTALKARNFSLESTLSDETRFKLELFTALNETRRNLQISQTIVERRDKEIDELKATNEELKAKLTEVVAVFPATSFSSSLHSSNSGSAASSFHYSKLLLPPTGNAVDTSPLPGSMVPELSLEPLVVGLGFPGVTGLPPQPLSPSVPLTQALSPSASVSSPSGPQHSNLDPNARIYTPKSSQSPLVN